MSLNALSTDLRDNNLDAIIYIKGCKYHDINEREGEIDVFRCLTGLEASAGAVVITKDENISNAVFVDGRYKLAASLSLDKKTFDIGCLGIENIAQWVNENLRPGCNIGCDFRYFSHELSKKIHEQLADKYVFSNIDIDDILSIPRKKRALTIHKVERSFTEDRFANVYAVIAEHGLDSYLLCDPCSISWMLNIRDFDSKYSLVVFGYLLITKDKKATLYLDDQYNKVTDNCDVCDNVDIKFECDLQSDLQKYDSVGIDEVETTSYLLHRNFVHVKNPCKHLKSIKNEIEINDMKEAARKDSIAIIKLLYWLISENRPKGIDELQVAERLLYFRKLNDDFIGESFQCIVAADEHASIVHYSPTEKSNKRVENILLIDSGGQYKYGTTDITRTICIGTPTEEQRLLYTLVLKGHIAVASAKMPVGSTGAQLDSLARQFLWRHFHDYDHGTGHGIGYVSHVHEGPVGISKYCHVPLKAGMIISNEPGYYKDNCFGIRIENMILVHEKNGFLRFETISLVPLDNKLIDAKLLTADEKEWIDAYNHKIEREILAL
jgi:Xaa-Pro aminopeptidase